MEWKSVPTVIIPFNERFSAWLFLKWSANMEPQKFFLFRLKVRFIRRCNSSCHFSTYNILKTLENIYLNWFQSSFFILNSLHVPDVPKEPKSFDLSLSMDEWSGSKSNDWEVMGLVPYSSLLHSQ